MAREKGMWKVEIQQKVKPNVFWMFYKIRERKQERNGAMKQGRSDGPRVGCSFSFLVVTHTLSCF